MFIKNIDQIEKSELSGDGIKDVVRQIPIGPDQGWTDSILRVFTLKPGGHTPKHSHDWHHINYIISGSGKLEVEGEMFDLPVDTFAVVPPNKEHQYSNPGDDDFKMICIVPSSSEY
jgi:quercetin dioxygenase-like cupin family protein